MTTEILDQSPSPSRANRTTWRGGALRKGRHGKVQPRPSLPRRILCLLLSVLFLGLAVSIHLLGVHTAGGQRFDDMVWSTLKNTLPGWLNSLHNIMQTPHTLGRNIIVAIAACMIAFALIWVLLGKRWNYLQPLVIFGLLVLAASRLKRILPRPLLVEVHSRAANTSPSDHTILAMSAVVMLILILSKVWQALVAVLGAWYAAVVAFCLVSGQWHRPGDAMMSMALVTSLALFSMVFMRSSERNPPQGLATRRVIWIVSCLLLAVGLALGCYGIYTLGRIQPDLATSLAWVRKDACTCALTLFGSLACLGFGTILAMKQRLMSD